MTQPTSRHMGCYRQDAGTNDGRLIAPTFLRNAPTMIAELAPWFLTRSGPVLEIGAGTGQHAAAFALAFRGLSWHPSDPDTAHRLSIGAWARELGAKIGTPLNIDAASNWALSKDISALGALTAVLSINVIHISPPTVLHGIVSGAARVLRDGGLLIFYGPFKEFGQHTGPGNEAFDRGLRADNANWGLRDVADIDAMCVQGQLKRAALITMPANNRLLIYKKARGDQCEQSSADL